MTRSTMSGVCLGLAVFIMAPAMTRASSTVPYPQIIFSNFGRPNDRYSCCSAYPETGGKTKYGKEFGEFALAFKFKVKVGDFKVSRVEVPLSAYTPNGPGHKLLFVLAEDADGLPGNRLFQQQVFAPEEAGCCKVEKVNVRLSVELLKDHAYWVEALPNPETAGGWADVSVPSSGLQAVSGDGGRTWGGLLRDRAAAFAIYGVPIK